MPQLIFFFLLFVGIGVKLKNEGKESEENFFTGFIAVLCTQGLFYWGGFYNSFGIPQFIMIAMCLVLLSMYTYSHGEKEVEKGITISSMIEIVFQLVLLYFGGFFNSTIELFK